MSTLEIVLASYIVLSQMLTMVLILGKRRPKLWWVLLILYPFGFLVGGLYTLAEEIKKKRKKKGDFDGDPK